MTDPTEHELRRSDEQTEALIAETRAAVAEDRRTRRMAAWAVIGCFVAIALAGPAVAHTAVERVLLGLILLTSMPDVRRAVKALRDTR